MTSVAIISRNRTTTYAELAELVARHAAASAPTGSARAIASPSCAATECRSSSPTWPCSASARVAVPLNPTSPAQRAGPPDRHRRGRRRGRRSHRRRLVARRRPGVGPVAAHGDRRRRRRDRRAPSTPPRCMAAEPVPVRRRRSRSPRRADVHERHGRRAEGGDAHPRQHARQPRPGALGPRAASSGRRRLRRDPAVPRLRAQRRPRPDAARRGDARCSCSASTRRRRSSRSVNAASPCCSVRRRCGWRSASSRRRRPTPSPRSASPTPVRRSCRVTVAEALERRFGARRRRGLRPHRGLARRHVVDRADAAPRLGRRRARRHRAAHRRRRRRRRPRRRRR